jgi:hypothetical protein
MQEQETNPKAGENVREAVRAFYDLLPYPAPVDDMDDNRRRWQDENRRRADFHPQVLADLTANTCGGCCRCEQAE